MYMPGLIAGTFHLHQLEIRPTGFTPVGLFDMFACGSPYYVGRNNGIIIGVILGEIMA